MKHYTVIPWGTLNMCAHFQVKGQSHFLTKTLTKNFQLNVAQNFVQPFMDFNETFYTQWYPEGPSTCVLIFRSSGQRSRSHWEKPNFNVTQNFLQALDFKDILHSDSLDDPHYVCLFRVIRSRVNSQCHCGKKLQPKNLNVTHIFLQPSWISVKQYCTVIPWGAPNMCANFPVIKSKVKVSAC